MLAMTHRTFTLSDAAASSVLAASHASHDGAQRTPLHAVRRSGIGSSVPQISDSTGGARASVLAWCAAARTHGRAAVADQRRGGNRATRTGTHGADRSRTVRQDTPRSRFGPPAATSAGHAWTRADLRRAVQAWDGVHAASATSSYARFVRGGLSSHRPAHGCTSRPAAAVAAFDAQREHTCLPRRTTRPRPCLERWTPPRGPCTPHRWPCGGRAGSRVGCGVIRAARQPACMVR